MKREKLFLLKGLILVILISFSCKDDNMPALPRLITNAALEITDFSAICGGEIMDDAGRDILQAGVCWGLDTLPDFEGQKKSVDMVTDTFSCLITGLLPDTIYHIRAWAATRQGAIAYGNDMFFHTKRRDTVREERTEIIRDASFEKGFALTPRDPAIVQQGGGFDKTYVDTLDFGGDGSHPVWMLAQWYSRYNLADAPLTEDGEGVLAYADDGKKIALYPDHSLWLEVDASREYDSARVNGQNWPALLIAQDFYQQSPRVGEVDRLEFTMELKIEKCVNMMAAGTYNTNLHTAQSPFYFILENNNPASDDYGQRIWFGLPSYDYRYPILGYSEIVLWDIGTSMYIYDVPANRIWGNISLHDGAWHKAKIDLKPWIVRALTAMREKGVFRNTVPEDLTIKGMNFGWETPGTFDAALRVKGISLITVKLVPNN